MRNVAIDHHRDKTRFRMVCGPPYTREKEVIQPGEFVLVKRPTLASLDAPSRPHVLQVVRTSDKGVIVS